MLATSSRVARMQGAHVHCPHCAPCIHCQLLPVQKAPSNIVPRNFSPSYMACKGGLLWLLQESMRLLPVAADGLLRVFPTDQEIGGYLVPAGVPVWLHIFNFHHNTLAWEEPLQYKPVQKAPAGTV